MACVTQQARRQTSDLGCNMFEACRARQQEVPQRPYASNRYNLPDKRETARGPYNDMPVGSKTALSGGLTDGYLKWLCF